MPDDDDAEQLRQELRRQAPAFDMGSSLPDKVGALVRRRQRVKLTLAIAGAAAVLAAVAVPLSSLRSQPPGRPVTPATTPSATTTPPATTPTTTPSAAVAPFACDSADLWNTPAGTAFSTRVTLGGVTVTLTGTTAATQSEDTALSNPQLSISVRGGGDFFEPVVPPDQTTVVIPWSLAPSTSGVANSDALCLARFPGGGLPTVLLGLETDGAHCCTVVRAIAPSPTGLGPVLDDNLGNPAASLSSGGGYAQIVTADNAFAYEFASYAGSGLPVRVLQVDHSRFVDVTRQRLDLVTADASTWWSAFTTNRGNGLGLLAPWVADECVLGESTSAWTTVDGLQTQGLLSGPAGWPTGAAYVTALKAFLAQHGYCSG
jgi:hypothetical protein